MASSSSSSPPEKKPAIQVIVLGSGGGPQESNTTAFLVRSVDSGWSKGSLVAVDAGVHLSAITRILEETSPAGLGTQVPLPHVLTSGPFAGLRLLSASASVNAAYVTCNLVDSYLITHPHLDHIAGFVINTAALGGMRPKRLAGLPSTIDAFKTHIFNNIIWPNLSDENNGAGLVTYMRLVEGGSPALGHGHGRGYLEINDGLAVKVWGVSHGHCMENHSHRGSPSVAARFGSYSAAAAAGPPSTRFGSMSAAAAAAAAAFDPSLFSYPAYGSPPSQRFFNSLSGPRRQSSLYDPLSVPAFMHAPPTPHSHPHSHPHHGHSHAAAVRNHSLHHNPHLLHPPPQPGMSRAPSIVSTAAYPASASMAAAAAAGAAAAAADCSDKECVYDSSAYFIHDILSSREVLIFGDVEPDSISLSPRNIVIWQEAAPKIAAGNLAAILIECSYDNSQPDDRLYGHLKPQYIIEELTVLALEVEAARSASAAAAATAAAAAVSKKRKRDSYLGNARVVSGDSSSGPTSAPSESVLPPPALRRRPTVSTIKPSSSTTTLSASIGNRLTDDGISPTISPTSLKPLPDTLSPLDDPPTLYRQPTVTNGTDGQQQQAGLHTNGANGDTHARLNGANGSANGAARNGNNYNGNHNGNGNFNGFNGNHAVHNGVHFNLDSEFAPDSNSTLFMDQDVPEQPPFRNAPLRGLKVVIIHVKDNLRDNAQPAGETILQELMEEEQEVGLGCEFILSYPGQSLYI